MDGDNNRPQQVPPFFERNILDAIEWNMLWNNWQYDLSHAKEKEGKRARENMKERWRHIEEKTTGKSFFFVMSQTSVWHVFSLIAINSFFFLVIEQRIQFRLFFLFSCNLKFIGGSQTARIYRLIIILILQSRERARETEKHDIALCKIVRHHRNLHSTVSV